MGRNFVFDYNLFGPSANAIIQFTFEQMCVPRVHAHDNYALDSLQCLQSYDFQVCSTRSTRVRSIINQIIGPFMGEKANIWIQFGYKIVVFCCKY